MGLPYLCLSDRLRRSAPFRPSPVLTAFAALTAGCREKAHPPREFDGQSAFGYIQTQVGFGPRIPGTEAHRRMGDWLDSLLRQRADTLVVQSWNHVTARGDTLPLKNFIARFNPRAEKRILLLAHWDSRPTADSPQSRDSTQPVLGANDGGSGVALLLGVADVLKRTRPTVGVDLLFVDGEDYGDFTKDSADVLIGSRYYGAHQLAGNRSTPCCSTSSPTRISRSTRKATPWSAHQEVVELVWDTAKDLGYGGYFISSPRHTLIDDHLELQKAGIRAIDVVDFDYPAWHTPYDTIDKVSAASLQVVGDVAVALVRREDQ